MWKIVVGLAAFLIVAWSAPAMAQAEPDGLQQDDQPGSEIEIDIGGGGGVQIERQDGQPLFGAAETQPEEDADANDDDPLDDPDDPSDVDSTDEELPGEGPENLSGPDDMDGLPD